MEPTTRIELVTSSLPRTRSYQLSYVGPTLERETGIEPATNSLEGCDSTTELLPPEPCSDTAFLPQSPVTASRCSRPSRSRPTSVRRRAQRALAAQQIAEGSLPSPPTSNPTPTSPRVGREVGGEGRVRTSVGTRPADLQSAAIDRSATSPKLFTRPATGQPRLGCFLAPHPAATDL